MNMSLRTAEDHISNSPPFFFRSVDRLRLEGYVAALTLDGRSLSLVSTHEAILDHYNIMLLARLRQVAPDFAVEVYFPASPEALLARFNEVLVNSSIQDAMDGKVAVAAPRIWIVHDTSALPDHEVELLARLVQHFPAANIRVVLLMTVASKKPGLLSSFGRSILTWEIEPPTPEQAQSMLEEARVEGREGAVKALLKKLSLAAARPSQPDPVSPPTAPAATPAPAAVTQAAAPETEQVLSRRAAWRWILAGVGMLTISFLLTAMFHVSSAGSRLNWSWAALFSGNNPMAGESSAAKPGNTQVPAIDSSTAAAAVAPLVPSSAVPVAAGAPNASDKAPDAAGAIKADVQEKAFNLPLDVSAGQSWIEKMPRDTLLIQHVAISNYQEAVLWMRRHPELTNVQLVATYVPNQESPQYVMVSGPFDSAAEVGRFIERGGIPKDVRVRTALSIKEQLTPPPPADTGTAKRKEKN